MTCLIKIFFIATQPLNNTDKPTFGEKTNKFSLFKNCRYLLGQTSKFNNIYI